MASGSIRSIRGRRQEEIAAGDWVGAAVLAPGERLRSRGRRKLYIWRSASRPDLYLITGRADTRELPSPLDRIAWSHFKTVIESGRPRIGFSEADAKRDIDDQGFHLVRVTVNTTKRVMPPYDRILRKSRSSSTARRG